MKLKRTIVAPVLVAGVAVLSGGWLLQQGVAQQNTLYQRARLFDEVLQYVSDRYVEKRPSSDLYQMAIQGMLKELGDPHTNFMSAEEYANLRMQTTGEYGGLGIQVGVRDGWVTVIAPLAATPAERAGIMAGDRIIEVEGKSTKGWTDDQAVKVLRGPKGQPVNIRVARIGVDEPIGFRIVRAEIQTKSVPYAYMVDQEVGIVRLNLFSQTSTQEIQQAVADLRRKGMKKLILDLRENPGGLLDQGVSVSDMFLKAGQSIVETRTRDPRENETFRATRGETLAGVPMVVLVNEYSASAAEIVAGALQDHDRALVVGAPTFGKGSVQTLFPLSGGNFLKMTTGRWYTPVGRSIQKDHAEDEEGALPSSEDTPIAVDGTPVPSAGADTVARKPYRTDSGRIVYGGGGIVPDVTLKPDTFTLAEQEFFKAIGKGFGKFNDVVFRYAVEYGRQNPNLRPDFVVTPQMRNVLYTRLRAAGVEFTAQQYAQGQRFVDLELARWIANGKFGPEVTARRANENSPVVRAAVGMLRGAADQASLFRQAQAQARTAAAR
jgi:carboxyl-terminal processing protease